MNILTFVTTVILTYYAMAIIQTVLHRLFGHRNRIHRIFMNHAMGHHAKYRTDALMTARYIDSETYVMFYYLLPTAVIGGVIYVLGGWLVVAGYAVGVVFAFWLHLHLHKHYHLENSYLNGFRWFQKKRELHFVHHRSVRRNYAIVEYWIDSLMGTRQSESSLPRGKGPCYRGAKVGSSAIRPAIGVDQ